MAKNKQAGDHGGSRPAPKSMELDFDADYEEMEKAGKKTLFGRFNAKFNDALQTSRGPESKRDAVAETGGRTDVSADDLAIRRARTVSTHKMIIPEGVIIEGSLTGGSETEISGKVDGDITVDGRLHLGASALVSGNVRAGSCVIEGLVEGKVECSDAVDVGPKGRLNGDVVSGKRINLAGQVYGNVVTPGLLKLGSTSKVNGDLRIRRLIMEEGASLNGQCAMRAPAERSEKK